MNINRLIKTILAATLCCLALTGQAEKTKVVRVMNGNEVVGEYLASNVDFVEVADYVAPLEINGHEYVDLGLPSGLKWATCNMGAEARNECGSVYYWGNPDPYSSTNKTSQNGVDLDDISGNAAYDAARAHWGSTWRIPTKAEVQELIDNCEFKYRNEKGVPGSLVTGPNGNQIFFPYNKYEDGYSQLWTSAPGSNNTKAWYFSITESYKGSIYESNRKGITYYVRPVSE